MIDKTKQELALALEKIATLQGTNVDPLRLASSISNLPENLIPNDALVWVCRDLGFSGYDELSTPDRALLPLVCFCDELGWGVVVDQDGEGNWLIEQSSGQNTVSPEYQPGVLAHVRIISPDPVVELGPGAETSQGGTGQFKAYVLEVLNSYRPALLEAVVASIVIGVLAMVTSLFSMQVYDRVIPTHGQSTLIILAAGVVISILVELAMKYARSHVMDHVIIGLDESLSRKVFERLLQLRVDQIPPSVGSLAAQIRGYEQVRNFYTSSTLYALVDLPIGILFLLIMAMVGTSQVALVPAVFAVLSGLMGLSIRNRVMKLASDGSRFANLKTGLLVEVVEGVETIKAGSGGWKFLSRWIDINKLTMSNDLRMRSTTEAMGYLTATIQQISYAALVVVGAIEVMQGHMTMGAMIACSILSGRILAPVAALPNMLVQHAHATAALAGLEHLYKLETDNHKIKRPLVPSRISGKYSMENVEFSYADSPLAIRVDRFEISPGERVAILGPIGAGKSTLLRLLSGMYIPQKGSLLLDGLEMSHISRYVISQRVGYLQQDHRLFLGTLRENLLIGSLDPGDDIVMDAMRRTGMDRFVAAHPKGLDRQIMEGGKGLSGGQRQLLAFTRLVLCNPDILLLDEPTATMDSEQEARCLNVLREEANAEKTIVIVTHKPDILPLVNRIIVVAGNRIVADGPRDVILNQLAKRTAPTNVVPVQRSV